MAIYQIDSTSLRPVEQTSFSVENITERGDLQRLLKNHIEVISPDTLIIAEEFGEFEGARRRIDLLGIDKEANLVVIELKRTEDGGHMELQAIRYAAMVSTMTFNKAVSSFKQFLLNNNSDNDAEESLLNFLDWDEPNEEEFAQDVKIVLASAEFSKELTASVIWLNERNLDISCYRLKPYKFEDNVLLDVQKIIPLPESTEYQIQVKEKKYQERISKESSRDFTKYDVTVNGVTHSALAKRRAIFHVIKQLCDSGIDPELINTKLALRRNIWRVVEGARNSDSFKETALNSAESGGPAFDPKRWFYAEDELIHTGDKTYALTKMWGLGTEEAIKLLLNTFPGHDISYKTSQS